MKRLTFILLLSCFLSGATVIGVPPVGNGTTDVTSTLQVYFTACRPGDTVSLPAGIFSINAITVPSGCSLQGVRGKSILKARTAHASMVTITANRDQSITGIVFDLNNLADVGLKVEWRMDGMIVRNNVFRNGGNPAALFAPGASQKGTSRSTSIDHNIFLNVRVGIFSYSKFNDAHIDYNWFDGFYQGIGSGFGDNTEAGSGLTVDHNVALRGQRMFFEVGGPMSNVSASYNYVAIWRPADNPTAERYDLCSAGNPYLCDSMAISLAAGGFGIVASHNRIYRQPGTSWGIEYTVTAAGSSASDNVIKNAGIAIFDGACNQVGTATNCATSRQAITANVACGGNQAANLGMFAAWPSSNSYSADCSAAGFPAEDPLPAMPFDPDTGSDIGGVTAIPATQSNTLGVLTATETSVLKAVLLILRDPAVSNTDRSRLKWVLLGLPQ